MCAATLLTVNVAAAQGVLSDRRTNVTFSGPVSLPGTTLPAGSYVFRLADSPANRHIVQVFDKDDQKIITTLLAVPASRDEAEGDPVIAFKETPSNRPPAVRYWYYAGERDGNEFIYPRAQAMQIASASGESVSAFDTDATDMDSWQKGSVTKVSPADAQGATTGSTGSTGSTASTTSTTSTTSTASTTTGAEPTTGQSGATGTSGTSGTTGTATGTTGTMTGTTSQPTTSQSTTSQGTTSQPTTSQSSTSQPTTAPTTTAPASTPDQPSSTTPTATADQTDRPVGTSGRSTNLPRTASELPMVGLLGCLAFAAAFGVRAMRRATV